MSEELLFGGACYRVIGICMDVHRQLGPGFREAVYKDALEMEFGIHGIPFKREFAFPVIYKGKPMQRKYPCDFLVFDEIILELKAATALVPEHEAQVINYLKSANRKLALLINFGTRSLPFKRIINQGFHNQMKVQLAVRKIERENSCNLPAGRQVRLYSCHHHDDQRSPNPGRRLDPVHRCPVFQ